jgi:apolipoprotein N-acyltransferase
VVVRPQSELKSVLLTWPVVCLGVCWVVLVAASASVWELSRVFALNSVAFAFALPAAVIGTTFVALRAGFKRYVRRRSAILQQLLDDIVRALPSAATNQLEGKTPEQ